jgi:diguanylate cyclase (GGDEF)-like protein/PAS domain S-box-containing protein
MSITGAVERLKHILPTGSTLPQEAWDRRHKAILVLLWLHVPGIVVYGTIRGGVSLLHLMGEAGIVAMCAIAASPGAYSPRFRAASATFGMVSSSAILVHLSGGLIEMHFHFFVIVAVVTLYQSWLPFLLAIAFVVIHHGTVGVLDSSAVYNHMSAITNPWKWALIHGLFIAGESAAGLTAWKLNEIGLDRERRARYQLVKVNTELGEAQAMSHIGSWDWAIAADEVWWSAELYQICGVDADEFGATYDAFLEIVHPGDRDRVDAIVRRSLQSGEGFDYQARIVRPGGDVRTTYAIGKVATDDAGQPVRLTGTLQDITDRKMLEDKVEYQAFHDSLTGLPNRALFLDRVEHALLRRQRTPSSVAVLFLDLDDFKTVNDSLGHQAGDELLIDLSRQLHASIRPADTVARLGGDEFGVLLEDIDKLDNAVGTAQRVLEIFEKPFHVEGVDLLVRGSIGIAVSKDDEVVTSGDILRDADTAMYAAKKHGKGSYELFAPEMQKAASERLQLKADLQRAVDEQEFILHYQPIVSLETGGMIGVEALVRWEHPERGLIPPLEFIPFSEESGLILAIGKWVLQEACERVALWQLMYPDNAPRSVSVNVSPMRFLRPGLVEEVAEALAVSGLPPECLVLEITESVLVSDVKVIDTLAELKDLGVNLALDDFGTGYSALSYLRDFPIDLLKVDKTFIDSVALGPNESALTRAVVELGRTLSMRVVAEGVEDDAQADVLRSIECELAQGYLFSKPLPESAMRELLKSAVRFETAVAESVPSERIPS